MNGTQADGDLAADVKWQRVTLKYDAFGRNVETTHIYASGATGGEPTTVLTSDTWSSSYDTQGRLREEASPTGVVGYEYDASGRKTRTWAASVGGTAATALSDVTYTYDALGQLVTVNTVKRDGSVVDGNGTDAGTPPETTAYHYDLYGRPDYTEMPNSVVEDLAFDNLDRLDAMRHYRSDSDNAMLADNALLDIFDYSYRADGKRTGLTETFHTTTPLTNSYAWTYDDAGRLVSEQLDSSDDSLDQTEGYTLDLVGNRTKRTIDKPGTANDTTDTSAYDSSDRLQSESRYANLTGTGIPVQTTTYGWAGTQQASKVVSIPATSTVTQSMSYGPGGQLASVITETKDGSGTVTARAQVEYRYDASGVRFIAIDSSDSDLATSTFDRVENGRVEYLIDHGNFTGYQQTIIETQKNAAGQAIKRISYTFGADEITQTTSTLDPATGAVTGTPETLVFGHDGHGSTRALFGAAAAFVQVFTYSAYGELLAIHTASGVRDATYGGSASALANPAGAKTGLLYNGENIDPRTGLYNLRARWYAAHSGRFDRLDPFDGNADDPFSFNKYCYAHGNPISFFDPSGESILDDPSLRGILAHHAVSNWAKIQRPHTTPGATLGTLLTSPLDPLLKPDLVDTKSKEYFELKPVTHKWRKDLQLLDSAQMASYDLVLGLLGYHRGDSYGLVPYTPGGLYVADIILTTQSSYLLLWPADRVLTRSERNGEGFIWYKVEKIPKPRSSPERKPFPVTEDVFEYEGERVKIRTWEPIYEPLANWTLTQQQIEALTTVVTVGLGLGVIAAVSVAMTNSMVGRFA